MLSRQPIIGSGTLQHIKPSRHSSFIRLLLAPASFNRSEWISFRDGFELKCPQSGFTFPRMVKLFDGGSEAFLSVLASSYISDADVFLSAARFLTPNGITLWTTSLRAHTSEASLTFQDLFKRFLHGSGIPCLGKFEAARGCVSGSLV
ncbi:hypothetical protein B0H14DRAFT_2571847 [Mycena olivaceomarginata]|nr:hypothetical protein B0H14DRAFT_2571847 [Mycena olivaceomarginata]